MASKKINSKLKNNPRFLAVDLLTKINKQGMYSNLGLNQVIKTHDLNAKDVNLLTNLVYGVIQHQLTLEYYLEPFIKNPKKMQPWVKYLLMTALFQMEYLDKIPTRAIFNETIEIAKLYGHVGTKNFVTGVLHQIKRQGLPQLSEIADADVRLSISTSTPLWLVKELKEQLGFAKTQALLESVLQAPIQTARVNEKLTMPAKMVKEITDLGLEVETSPVTPLALRISGGFIPSLKQFAKGEVFVQDESAMLAVESMQVQPTDQVLDACAAPGGKTTQIASSLTTGQVTALDIHDHKVKLIEENAKRAHVAANVKALQGDARKLGEVLPAAQFDKILVDAPCSGIGLLRRKPEIKYGKSLQDSLNLHQIQVAILNETAKHLKVGGTLTYSTCTILNQENQATIDAFLSSHPEFVQVKTVTANNVKAERDELGLTIYPDDYLSDGFFIATLKKRA